MKQHNKQRRSQKGYTLIELILYITVLGSLLMGISLFFVTATSARVKNQTIAEVDRQGTTALEYVTQTIRNASSITSPAAGGTGSSLTLVVPTSSLSPTIFSVSSGVLQVQEGASAAVGLTNSKVTISSLTFKNLSRSGTPGVVQVSFIVTRVNAGNRNEYDYQKTFTATAALRP